MFGLFGGAATQQPQPQQQQQAPQQAQQIAQPGGAQPDQGQQGQQNQQQAPQQSAPNGQVDLVQLLGLGPKPAPQQQQTPDPAAQASAALSALLSGQHTQLNDSAPAINSQKLAEQLAKMDMTGGVDLAAALGLNLDDQGKSTLNAALNQMQTSVIATIVPLMNALVQQAAQHTMDTVLNRVHQGSLEDRVLTTFQTMRPGAMQQDTAPLIQSLAGMLASKAPKGTEPEAIAKVLESLVTQIGSTFASSGQPPQQRAQLTDMSGIFR